MSDGLNIPLNIESKTAFNKLERDAKASGEKAGSGLSSGIGNALSVGAGVLGAQIVTRAIGALTGAFKDSIGAANRQEDAINSLNIALKSSGRFTELASRDFQEYASSLQNVSTYGDELILENAALIQSLGQLDQKGLKRATGAAIDLAAALNIDLRSAATLVGKAAVGEVGSFSRYGVSIKKGKDNAETFARTLEALESKFGGAAAGKINTTRGAYLQLSNAFGDLTEKVGALITKSETVKGSISLLAGFVSDLNSAIDPSGVSIAQKINETSQAIGLLETNIKKLESVEASSSVIASRNAQLDLLKIKLADLTKEQTIFNEKLASEKGAAPSVAAITEEEKQKRLDAIKSIGLSEQQLLLDKLATEQELLSNAFELKLISEDEFFARSLELSNRFEEAKLAAKPPETSLEDQAIQFDDFFNQVGAGMQSFAKTAQVTGKSVAASLTNGIANAAGSAFSAFGAALVNGDNALKAFAQAFISAIGQMAVQQGTAFILQGIGYQFVPGFQGIGAGLIGAGAALAVFGGALSAFAGGGKSGASSAGSSTTQSNNFSQQSQPQQIDQTQKQDPQTAVTVNIQGDVLDSEESSLRIAELLQKAVSDQGVRFV